MKALALFLSGCIFLLFSSYTPVDQIKKNEVLVKVILQKVRTGHFESKEINDQFSKDAYDLYLERLDLNKRFLIREDIEQLSNYKTRIDDELQAGSFRFFELSVEIINKRIKNAEAIYKEILDKPFDFTKEEDLELDPDKRDFAANETVLKEQWRKYLKYQTMTRLHEKLKLQEEAIEKNDTSVKIKTMEELEVSIREKVRKNHEDWFNRLYKLDNDDRMSYYLNAVTSVYDPHTVFFPPRDKENFDIAMSGKLEGIGARLTEKGGYVKVQRIVIGSAAYRQGQLEAGDLILKVAQGDKEPVDVVDMRIENVVKLIRGKKGTEVRLTVKKVDGATMVIPIIRDIVNLEETYAKSVLLKKTGQERTIGYIDLPKFYADFNKTNGRNCSEDVKRELMKLNEENVDGIILDLRDNGGGSLNDVVKMAGLFIKQGPIVQIKSKKGAPYILKDDDPDIQYGGPLVVLVNSFSASASEILAAAMQDYHRAVIVGSANTFGKGTVQRMFNLDTYLSSEQIGLKPLGAIKLTTQKFYRIDGRTTQMKGMVPDIILPDNYSYIEVGEKEHDYVIAWDEIEPVAYDDWKQSSVPMDRIYQNSKDRVAQNPTFKLINENALRMKRQRDKTLYTLNLEQFKAEQKRRSEEGKKYKDIQKEIKDLEISSLATDIPDINSDSTKMKRTEKWHKSLKKDVYLDEAIAIISDMM